MNLLEVVLVVWNFQQIQGAQQIGVPKVRVLAKEAGGRSAWLPDVVSFAMILICWPP